MPFQDSTLSSHNKLECVQRKAWTRNYKSHSITNHWGTKAFIWVREQFELTSSREPTCLSGLLFFTREMKGLDHARVRIIGVFATAPYFISCDRRYSLITAFLPTEPGCNIINILDMQPHPLIKVGMHEKGSLTSLVQIISNVPQIYFCP